MSIDTNEMRKLYPRPKLIRDHEVLHAICDEIDALRERAFKAERQLKDESFQASQIFTRLRAENEALHKENMQLQEAAFGEVAGIKEPAIRMQRETIERQSETIKRLEAHIPHDGVRWLTRSEQEEIDALRARVAELETSERQAVLVAERAVQKFNESPNGLMEKMFIAQGERCERLEAKVAELEAAYFVLDACKEAEQERANAAEARVRELEAAKPEREVKE